MLCTIKRVLASLLLLLPGTIPFVALFAVFCCVAPTRWIEALPAPLRRICMRARRWAYAKRDRVVTFVAARRRA